MGTLTFHPGGERGLVMWHPSLEDKKGLTISREGQKEIFFGGVTNHKLPMLL